MTSRPAVQSQAHGAAQPAPQLYGPLTQYAAMHFAGADARTFLHGQLTCDVAALPPDRWTWAGYCTAKGRLLCTGLLWCGAEDFYLMLPVALAESMAKRLRMYVLRAKVSITSISMDRQLIGLRLPLPENLHDSLGITIHGQPHGCVHSADVTALTLDKDFALLWISSDRWQALLSLHAPSTPPANEHDWDAASVARAEPWLAPVNQESYVPQMLNLEQIGGISFTKGCYPGQEIVARTQHLGQVKRRLRRFACDTVELPAAGVRVLDERGHPVGEVLRAARMGLNQCTLLAVISVDASVAALHLEVGARLWPEPLPYALP